MPGRDFIGYSPRHQMYFVINTTVMKLITKIIFLCVAGVAIGKFTLVLTK